MADDTTDPDAEISTDGRALRLVTPIDTLFVATSVTGFEALSRPFCFDLTLKAEKDDIDFGDLLGASATIKVDLPEQSERVWNGILTRFAQTRQDDEFTYYEATLEPALVRLGMRSGFRVFQDQKVDDIVAELLKDLTTRTAYTYAEKRNAHNFRVQYGESDLAFVSRMLEEAGIFYYFEHTAESHTMVLCDDSAKLPKVDDLSPIDFLALDGGTSEDPVVTSWSKTQRLTPTRAVARDTHPQMPGDTLEVSREVAESVQIGEVTHKLAPDGKRLSLFSYPGGYAPRYDALGTKQQDFDQAKTADEVAEAVKGSPIQHVRTDGEAEAQQECDLLTGAAFHLAATSDALAMKAGGVFTLADHFNANGDYFPIRVGHRLVVAAAGSSAAADVSVEYENELVCWPAGLKYLPPRTTPKPSVAGVQSAVVVAHTEADEEKDKPTQQLLDRYGRVKVRFPWDLRSEADDEGKTVVGPTERSCWVRVAQFWAGAGWGAYFWPRHGNEVLVAFEHGDPDRPVVVGSVYNAGNMPPKEMPAQDHLCGIRSASIDGDSTKDFNDLTFNDQLDNEHVEIHSEAHFKRVNEQSEHTLVLGTSVNVCGTMFGAPS